MNKILKVITGLYCAVMLSFTAVSVSAEPFNDSEIGRRIEFIQKKLDEGTTSAKRWQYSWMFIYGATAELQFGLATTQTEKDDRNDQYDNIVGGATSMLGVGDLTFNPLVAWNAAEKLRSLPDATVDEKRAKLEYAEQLLKQCADREEYGRSWKTHALNALVNIIGGVAIICDGGRGSDGVAFMASSMAVSELQIFTMPTRAIDDWQTYSKKSFKDLEDDQAASSQDRFFISANPKGIFCTILF